MIPGLGPLPSAEEAVSLLAECGLPVADISSVSPPQFFGIRDGGALVAVVGLELYPPFGLLRSLAVRPDFRNRGFGRQLVAHAEAFAAARGVESLFLLTTTAERFFLGLGYLPASRDAAPAEIQATSQFAGLCPASSAFLSKRLPEMGNGCHASALKPGMRALLLTALLALGIGIGVVGQWLTQNDVWFLAIPIVLAIGWSVVATEQCVRGQGSDERSNRR